jgi:hypothetical protein
VVRWPLLLGLLPMMPLLVLLVSALEAPQRQVIAVAPEEPATGAPLRLEAGPLGAPLIRLDTELPANTAMGLAVELLDAGGSTVLELAKDGWRETGTWAEGGERGTWEESDTGVRLALRPPRTGVYRLRLTLEDLADTRGLPLEAPLAVRVTVRNHSVNAPLLWFTAAVTQVMVWIVHSATYGNAKLRRVLRVEENRAALRSRVGGAGLVRLAVRARYERPHSAAGAGPSLPAATLELLVTDALGRLRLDHSLRVPPTGHASDGDHWLTVDRVMHLQVNEPTNLRFRLTLPETLDDGGEPWGIEWLELVLEDGLVSPHPVARLTLQAAEG